MVWILQKLSDLLESEVGVDVKLAETEKVAETLTSRLVDDDRRSTARTKLYFGSRLLW